MAASKLRMVSSGRSHRLLVGLDLSGSAVGWISACDAGNEGMIEWMVNHTDGIAIGVHVLHGPDRRQRRLDRRLNDAWLGFVHGHGGVCLCMQSLGFFLGGCLVSVDVVVAVSVGLVRLV